MTPRRLCSIAWATRAASIHSPIWTQAIGSFSSMPVIWKKGSPQESDEVGILGGFLESEEFRLGSGQSLCLEKEIVDVTVAPASAKDRLDISVDCFHHAQRNFIRAIVQDSIEMLD